MAVDAGWWQIGVDWQCLPYRSCVSLAAQGRLGKHRLEEGAHDFIFFCAMAINQQSFLVLRNLCGEFMVCGGIASVVRQHHQQRYGRCLPTTLGLLMM